MEDKKIKDVFNAFNPELSNDFSFMARLKQNMQSVELVREHNKALQQQTRKAVAIAAAVGFIFGMLFSMFLPAIGETMKGLQNTVSAGSFIALLADNYFPIVLTAIAGASAFIALNTFELALFFMKDKNSSTNIHRQ